MKPLSNMSNAEKIRMLGKLMPAEIKPMMRYVLNEAAQVVSTKLQGTDWERLPVPRETWIAMARDVQEELTMFTDGRKSLCNLAATMTMQYGHKFLIQSIVTYGQPGACTNPQMRAAIQAFFPDVNQR